MKVWITKHALTQGIWEVDAALSGTSKNMIQVRRDKNDNHPWSAMYYHKGEWHEKKEHALAHAEDMKERKLASLRKQIAKISKLSFE